MLLVWLSFLKSEPEIPVMFWFHEFIGGCVFLALRWVCLWVGCGVVLMCGWLGFFSTFFVSSGECCLWSVRFFCFVFAAPCSGVCWRNYLCSHLANLTRVLWSLGWMSCRASSWFYATSFYVGPHFLSGYYAATVYRHVIVLSVNCSLMASVSWWLIKTLQVFFFVSTLNTWLVLWMEGYEPS